MHYLGSDIRGKSPGGARLREEGRRRDRRQLRRDPLGARGSDDPARRRPERDRAAPPSGRRRPVVVHAPSSRRRKGTDHVLAACAELDVELRIVEGLHHEEALEHYRDADIVVDQLNAGWYGLFAIECMALGKPVVTFLHDEAVRRTEEAYDVRVPIVNATAEHAARRGSTSSSRSAPTAARRSGGRRAPTSSRCTTSSASPTGSSTSTRRSSSRRRAPRCRGRPDRAARRAPGRRSRSVTPTSTATVPARVERSSRRQRAAPVGLGSQLPAAREALGDLRDRRARLAGHRGAPPARLHALPEPDRLRPDRDAARADDRDGARPPGRDHERLLPLLLRRRRRRRGGCACCARRSGSRWAAPRSGSRPAARAGRAGLDAPLRRRPTRPTSSARPASRSGRR